jgi:hypothetical protein
MPTDTGENIRILSHKQLSILSRSIALHKWAAAESTGHAMAVDTAR